MAETETARKTAEERFIDFNQYAAKAIAKYEANDANGGMIYAGIAQAFALERLRTEIHFSAKRGS